MNELTKKDYDNFLDEVYPPYEIGYLKFYASDILHELDPIAYNEGFLEWLESQENENV